MHLYILAEETKMQSMRNTLLLVTIAFAVAAACGRRSEPRLAPEVILAQMRADSSWIRELDSLAQIAIGSGAKCIDPVWHTFSYEGRTWFFNQDWGGVLEIPSDYLPEDDLWQAELSFHGTRAWSPDSLILVSFFAGFQALTPEESKAAILSGLENDGFVVQRPDEKENVLTLRARSAEGINYYGRHILGENGIEYSVSVQYPDRKASEALKVIEKADRYPAGPNGLIFKGEAF